jgi:V-type H+-transporting ATPase subunit D
VVEAVKRSTIRLDKSE